MDFKLNYTPDYTDFITQDSEPVMSRGLINEVLCSLFSEEGLWTSFYTQTPGSNLHLSLRGKQSEENKKRIETHIQKALTWMIHEGITEKNEVSVRFIQPEQTEIKILLTEPDQKSHEVEIRYQNTRIEVTV